MNISIIGSGSWGIALGCLLFDNNHNVKIWSRSEKEVLPASLKDLYTNVIPEADGSFTYSDDTPWVFEMRRYSYARDIILVLN